MNPQKQSGFSSILIILIVVGVLVAAGGVWYYLTTPIGPCPQDLKTCPDGTQVGRVSPKCEFASCPEVKDETADWKTYQNEEYGFEVRYLFDKYETLEKADYIIIKPKELKLDIQDPGYLLVIEEREREQSKTWEEFILAGAKLEEKNHDYYISDERTPYDSSAGKEIYYFCRALAPTVCHTFYVLEKDDKGVPKKGIDVYFWFRYQALGNPYALDYKAIVDTIKFIDR